MSQTGGEDFFVSFGSNADLWAQAIELNLDKVQRKVAATQALINRLDSKTAKIMANGGGGGLPPQRGPGSGGGGGGGGGGKLGVAGEGYLSDTVARLQLAADHADANATSLAIAAKAIESIPGRVENAVAGTMKTLLGNLSQVFQQATGRSPDIIPGTQGGLRAKGTPGAVPFEVNAFMKQLREQARQGAIFNAGNIRNISPQQIDQAGVDRIVNAINAQTTTLVKKLDGLTVRTRGGGGDDDPPSGGSGGGGGSGRPSGTGGAAAVDQALDQVEELADAADDAELSLEVLEKTVKTLTRTLAAATPEIRAATQAQIDLLNQAVAERKGLNRAQERKDTGISRTEQSKRAKEEFREAEKAKEKISTAERDRRNEQSALIATAFKEDFADRAKGRASGKNEVIDAVTLRKMIAAFREAGIAVAQGKSKAETVKNLQAGAREYAATYGEEGYAGFATDNIKAFRATEIPDTIKSLVGDLSEEVQETIEALRVFKKAGQSGAQFLNDAVRETRADDGEIPGAIVVPPGMVKGGLGSGGAALTALEDLTRRRDSLLSQRGTLEDATPGLKDAEQVKKNNDQIAALNRSIKALDAEMERANKAFQASETYSTAEYNSALETVRRRNERAEATAYPSLLNDPTYDPNREEYDPKNIKSGAKDEEAERALAMTARRRIQEIRGYVDSVDDEAQQWFGLMQALERNRGLQSTKQQRLLGLERTPESGRDESFYQEVNELEDELEGLKNEILNIERALQKVPGNIRQLLQSEAYKQGLIARRGSLVGRSTQTADSEAQKYYSQEGTKEAQARREELRVLQKAAQEEVDAANAAIAKYGPVRDSTKSISEMSEKEFEAFDHAVDTVDLAERKLAEFGDVLARVTSELNTLDAVLETVTDDKGRERERVVGNVEGRSSYENRLAREQASQAAAARRSDISAYQAIRDAAGESFAGLKAITDPGAGRALARSLGNRIGFAKGSFYAAEDDPDRPGQKTVSPERIDKLNAALGKYTSAVEGYNRTRLLAAGRTDMQEEVEEAAAELTKAAELLSRRFATANRGIAPAFAELTGYAAPDTPIDERRPLNTYARADLLRQRERARLEQVRTTNPTKANRSQVFAVTQDTEIQQGAERRLAAARKREEAAVGKVTEAEELLNRALASLSSVEREQVKVARRTIDARQKELDAIERRARVWEGPNSRMQGEVSAGDPAEVERARELIAQTRKQLAVERGRATRFAKGPNIDELGYDAELGYGPSRADAARGRASGLEAKLKFLATRLEASEAGLRAATALFQSQDGREGHSPSEPVDTLGYPSRLGYAPDLEEYTRGLRTKIDEAKATRDRLTRDAFKGLEVTSTRFDEKAGRPVTTTRKIGFGTDAEGNEVELEALGDEASDLRVELERLRTTVRREIVRRIADARAEGDLKENAGYHAARDELAQNLRQTALLQDKIDSSGFGVYEKLQQEALQAAGEVARLEQELESANKSLAKSTEAWEKRKKALTEERAALVAQGKYGAAEIKRLRNDFTPGNAQEYTDVRARTARINEIDAELKATDAKKRATVETRALTGAEKERVAAIKAEMAEIRKGPYTRAQRKAAFAEGDEATIAAIDKARKRLSELRAELKALGVVRSTSGTGRTRTPQELERQTRADELRARRQQVRDSGPYTRGARKAALAAGDENLAGEINDRINEIRRINAELKKLGFGGRAARAARAAGVDAASPGGAGDTDNERDVLIQSLNVLRAILTQLKSGLRVSGRASGVDTTKQPRLDPNLPRTFAVGSSGEAEDVTQAILDQQSKQASKGKSTKDTRTPGTTEAAKTGQQMREEIRAAERLEKAWDSANQEVVEGIADLQRLVAETKAATTAEQRLALEAERAAKEIAVVRAIGRSLNEKGILNGNDRRDIAKTLLRQADPDIKGAEFDDIARSARFGQSARKAASPSIKSAGRSSALDFEDGFAEGMALFGRGGFFKRVLNSTGTFIVRNFTAGLVFGLTNYMQQVLTQAIQTEATFVRVSSALDATGTEYGNIRSDLAAISTDYGVALNDVYETAAGLAGLFTDAGDLASATRIVAQLQTISGGALNASEAMGVLASTLSAFEALPGEDLTEKLLPQGVEGMQKVADVLTVVQNNLGTNIETTAEGVSRMAGLARQLNLSFEETAVFTAQIAKQTNQTGAAAGEQFSRILGALQTGRGRGAVLEAYGQNSQVAASFAESDYGGVLKGMIAGWDGLSDAQKRNVAVSVAGQRQAAAFNALMNNGTKTLNILAKAQNANGDAAERMEKLMNTLNKRLDVFQTQLQNLASNLVRTGVLNFLGLLLLGANATLDVINSLFDVFNKFADENGFLGFLRDAIGLMLGAGIAIKAFQFGVAGLKGAVAQSAIASGAQAGVAAQRAAAAQNAVSRPRFSEFGQRGLYTRSVGYGFDRTVGIGLESTGRGLTGLGQRLNVATKEVGGLERNTSLARQALGRLATQAGTGVGVYATGTRGVFQGNSAGASRALNLRAAELRRNAQLTVNEAARLRAGAAGPALAPSVTGSLAGRASAAALEKNAQSMLRQARFANAGATAMGRLAGTMGKLGGLGAAADVALLALTATIVAFVESSAENRERLKTAEAGAKNLQTAADEGQRSKTTAEKEAEAYVGTAAQAFGEVMDGYKNSNALGGRWATFKASVDDGLVGVAGYVADGLTGIFGDGTDFTKDSQYRKAGIVSEGPNKGKETQGLSFANDLVSEYTKAMEGFDGLVGGDLAEVILNRQEIMRDKIANEAKRIAADESLSETQKQAAIANLESASKLIADMTDKQVAIAQGIGQSVLLTGEQIQKVQDVVATLQATSGRLDIGATDLAPIYAELIKDTGAQEGSRVGQILGQLASGSADQVDVAVANVYLLQDEINQLYASWQSKLNQGLPDEAAEVRSQLLAAMQQLGGATNGAIQTIIGNAQLIGDQLRNVGDYDGAVEQWNDAMRRAAGLIDEGGSDTIEMVRATRAAKDAAARQIAEFNKWYDSYYQADPTGLQAALVNPMRGLNVNGLDLNAKRPGTDVDLSGLTYDQTTGPFADLFLANAGVTRPGQQNPYQPAPQVVGGQPPVRSAEEKAQLYQAVAQATQEVITEQTADLRIKRAKTKDPKLKAFYDKKIAELTFSILSAVNAGLVPEGSGLDPDIIKEFGNGAITNGQIVDAEEAAANAGVAYGQSALDVAQTAAQSAADIKAAQLGVGAAWANARGDAVQAARIQAQIARVQLAAARQQLALAQASGTPQEIAQAQIAVYNAQASLIAANAAVDQAQQDLVQSRFQVAIAVAEAAGHSVEAARRTLAAARQALAAALRKSGGKITAEVNAARVQAIQAEAALRDAKLQDSLDTINFNLEMGKITQASAIAALQEILRTQDLTRAQRRQLMLQIKGMKDELADSQWNFGDIKLPTPYQMRRYIAERRDQYRSDLEAAAAIGRDGQYAGGGYGQGAVRGGDTITVENKFYIDGADVAKVRKIIREEVGGGGVGTRTTGARRGR